MKHVLLVLIIISAFVVSCKNNPTGKELLPELDQTDSVALVYYRVADIDSSYTYLPLNDEEFIKEIIEDVNGEVQEEAKCAKEGEILCYKSGQKLITISFSYATKECIQFRCERDGNKFQFKMSEDVKDKLTKFKSFARDPEQDGAAFSSGAK